ncbi:MAG TPA: sigma-70 family RNA polymerase sigma factor [Planctomycetota bacterium]|nr:sigma-70 family RNA polymerase sigma factor [Planctomycetota bacterium]
MGRETSIGGSRGAFGNTRWTVILRARDEKRLEEFLQNYWKPCYFYIRRKGQDVEDAKDLTQGFFLDFLQRDALARVTRTKGRFRSYLLACLDHYLANEYDKRKAQKRGAGRVFALDFETVETIFAKSDVDSPEKSFRRQWAIDHIERALQALKKEMGGRFDALREYITAGQPGTLKEVAEKLDLSEANVKVIIHRARKRYRELLKEEVARTVERPGDVEEELLELFSALA